MTQDADETITSTVQDNADHAVVIAVPTRCWRVDHGADGELTRHHPTQADAETEHVDRVRANRSWVLSATGVFDQVPAKIGQEPLRCYAVTCPRCGAGQHIQERYTDCIEECGHEFDLDQFALVHPDQARLFEALPSATDGSCPG